MSERFFGGDFIRGIEKKPKNVGEVLSGAIRKLESNNEAINPIILDSWRDDTFLNSLPEKIRTSEEALSEYLLNSGKFNELISSERQKFWNGDGGGLFGPETQAKDVLHSDGRERRVESGNLVNIEYLRKVGVDPRRVLFFRVTQPSQEPKPELYWTSDLVETERGLAVEISTEDRKNSIILISDLENINSNGGLIQDINDDQGLSVRQIGVQNFDQKSCLGVIKK